MKKMLLVPPADWTGDDTKSLRAALKGTDVDVSVSKILEMLPGMDYMLVVTGSEGGPPATLRAMGEAARAHNVEIIYANLPVDNIAGKIIRTVTPP